MTVRVSDEVVDAICVMYNSDKTLDDISSVFGVSRRVARRLLVSRGVEIHQGGARTANGRAKISAANMRKIGKTVSAEDMARLVSVMETPVSTESVIAAYLRGLTIKQVAEAVGCSRTRAREIVVASGVPMHPRGWLTPDGRCRKGASGRRRKGIPMPVERRMRLSATKLAVAERTAKGRSLKPSGYVEFTRGPNKSRGEHRVSMEQILGRKLRRSEVVHHIDGNRRNNDPDNLVVLSNSEHCAVHNSERYYKKRLAQKVRALSAMNADASGSNPDLLAGDNAESARVTEQERIRRTR